MMEVAGVEPGGGSRGQAGGLCVRLKSSDFIMKVTGTQ